MTSNPNVISLSKLKETAIEWRKHFKVGDRVIIDSYSGIWSQLVGLTGIISRINNDIFKTFDIDLDHPELLQELHCWDSNKEGGLTVSLNGGGIFLLSQIEVEQPDIISQLNQGKGLSPRPYCTETPALTDIKVKIAAIEEAMETSRGAHRKSLDKLVEIRKKYVDNQPEIIAAQQEAEKAQKDRDNYYNTLTPNASNQNIAAFKKLQNIEAQTDATWRNLFQKKQDWAEANIPELQTEKNIFNNKKKEHYAFEETKLNELTNVIREYLGRRHSNIIDNGKTFIDEDGITNQPLICKDCQWNFVVKSKKGG